MMIPWPWPDIETTALRLAFGPLVTFARSAGTWCVVLLTDPNGGRGAIITRGYEARGKATLEALQFAIDRVVYASRAVPVVVAKRRPQRSISGVTPGIIVTQEQTPCPHCGRAELFAFAFGRAHLGRTCRACRWDEPENS